MVKVHIQYFNQFKMWQHYPTKHHEAVADRTAKNRATRTNTRHRIVDNDGKLLDLIEP